MTSTELAPLLATALTRSAHEGARIVALHWLHELVVARDQWFEALAEHVVESDPAAARRAAVEALHDARVALRRLRATLREHRVALDLDEGARVRRALRRLGGATSSARDRDVSREWLDAERDALPEEAQREADAMLLELSADVASGRESVTKTLTRQFDPIAARLSHRLSRYCLPQTVGEEGQTISFARHLADRVDRGSAHLRHDLGMIDGVRAQGVLHRVRIRLKRQRAMLSPFARVHPAIGAWYALATEGQDLLGAMRDASLLAKRARRQNREALAQTLRAVALAHFEAFSAGWCADPDRITHTKHAAVQALRSIADARDAHVSSEPNRGFVSLPAGHGLPMEIERKFLLHGLPPHAAMVPSHRIEQGWLPGTMLRERLRRSIAPNGDERLTRTIKLGPPGERIEVEEPTDADLFAALWPLTVNARIRKRRHAVRVGAFTWEVDVFLDRDLVLAEIELDDVAQHVEIPEWLASFIVREVTHETAYLNSVMAQRDATSPDRGSH